MVIYRVHTDEAKIVILGGIVGVDSDARTDLEFCTIYRKGDDPTELHVCPDHNIYIIWPAKS